MNLAEGLLLHFDLGLQLLNLLQPVRLQVARCLLYFLLYSQLVRFKILLVLDGVCNVFLALVYLLDPAVVLLADLFQLSIEISFDLHLLVKCKTQLIESGLQLVDLLANHRVIQISLPLFLNLLLKECSLLF